MECCPQHAELWLAFARLSSHDQARRILNNARKEIPADPAFWFAGAKLEESNGNPELAAKIISRAPAGLRKGNGIVVREEWLKVCLHEPLACGTITVANCCTATLSMLLYTEHACFGISGVQ